MRSGHPSSLTFPTLSAELHTFHDNFRQIHARDVGKDFRHLQTFDGRYTDQDVYLVEDISPGKFIQPGFHPIDVEHQVGLEELRASINLFLLPQGLEFWIG